MRKVPAATFKGALSAAREERQHIKDATTDPHHMPDDDASDYYLSHDGRSGFGVTKQGTGIGLFSTEKGRGLDLLRYQIDHGGMAWADHFGGVPAEDGTPTEGYLDKLYHPLGMIEFGRQANWTPGGPDVVYRVVEKNRHLYPDNPYEEDGVHYQPPMAKESSRDGVRVPPGQMHGVPWADEEDRDDMIRRVGGN